MTVVVAYADTPPGHAAVEAAVTESVREQEPVVLVPAVRGEVPPEVAELERRWPGAAGRFEVERGDLGDPSDAVVQVAQRRDARLVVLGLRARTPVGKLVFGSTAQRILLDATCPVLAVKPPPA
ncbi:universal stress protein [Nocardioides sp. zg-1230]|uniref:universal stress protein n=1 Tax=Nocardioides sp. zg-1230 TaxID=2736601 RepID=UPI001558039E|nr:universal stress protein [Nocardioides sp. zg-1230]NPC42141.1 universal stress protein [Nocardioides sp. zg-1230]